MGANVTEGPMTGALQSTSEWFTEQIRRMDVFDDRWGGDICSATELLGVKFKEDASLDRAELLLKVSDYGSEYNRGYLLAQAISIIMEHVDRATYAYKKYVRDIEVQESSLREASLTRGGDKTRWHVRANNRTRPITSFENSESVTRQAALVGIHWACNEYNLNDQEREAINVDGWEAFVEALHDAYLEYKEAEQIEFTKVDGEMEGSASRRINQTIGDRLTR